MEERSETGDQSHSWDYVFMFIGKRLYLAKVKVCGGECVRNARIVIDIDIEILCASRKNFSENLRYQCMDYEF